ncbi:hypothetical protein AB8Z38_22975 [Bradyrhizobium sp. LLZ17]|uniref:Uncharacterized protein n=1 Tax=Bradyrhizobium sp. LLZ17 TaxID=3239388 RepID=A0AB39XEP9_9BRAD
MSVRKTTLLHGAPKRPTAPAPHPGMKHAAVIGGEKVMIGGVTPTQVGHMLRGDEVHRPSRGKHLPPVETNPGTRSRRSDAPAGMVAPAAIVDRAAPGAVKSRRV